MNSLMRRCLVLALSVLLSNVVLASSNAVAGQGTGMPGVLVARLDMQTPPDNSTPGELDASNPRVRAAMDVQNRHNGQLRAIPDVIGTGTGVDENGNPAVIVFAKKDLPVGAVPASLEGIPVRAAVTGVVSALATPGGSVSNTSAFPPPSPIGVSTGVYTGTQSECFAGTVSCRLKDSSGNLYALSNNHVYAMENAASPGSTCVQPGMYDTTYCASPGKRSNTYNIIGSLANFVPINFSGVVDNYVDCAVSTVVSTSGVPSLGTATPSTGYGTPNSLTWFDVNPSSLPVGLAVQKYGRTTSLTKGQIYAINVSLTVDYGTSGTASFANQIAVYSPKAFIKAGDSGSLLVTNDANDYPVGLLYAGNSSGTFAYANPINAVLSSLSSGSPSSPTPTTLPGLVIDGK